MKILILSSVLALSLGFPGWLFRSYGQNRELFQHAGQKIASLEEEKSSLEEQLNKHHPNTQNPDADSILGKQEEYLKRQILKQDQNMDALQRFLQESEHQLRLLKTKERELKNLLEKKKKAEASIIHAPQSIAGATITIEYKLEGEDNVSKKTLKSGEYWINKSDYIPQRNTALISFEYSEQFNAQKSRNWIITSASSFKEWVNDDKKQLAVITFTGRKGNTYTGTVKGYMVTNIGQEIGIKLAGIVITLP
ncbi:hypothetical protein [Akkermansia sp.]|uniref:hypothetical protein n=1 Tax=Akkermansia sp. TaxID=1872421 RepID=UPI003AABCCA2